MKLCVNGCQRPVFEPRSKVLCEECFEALTAKTRAMLGDCDAITEACMLRDDALEDAEQSALEALRHILAGRLAAHDNDACDCLKEAVFAAERAGIYARRAERAIAALSELTRAERARKLAGSGKAPD